MAQYRSIWKGTEIDNGVGRALNPGTAGGLAPQGVIGAVEVSPAESPHNTGEIITYNGSLYRVIENISIGSSLQVGTNIAETSLSEEIKNINYAKSDKSVSFTVTLDDASWNNGAQTVSNSNFYTSGYAYIVTPVSTSFAAYTQAQIYADDVSTAGYMTFHCSETPSVDIVVNVLMLESITGLI